MIDFIQNNYLLIKALHIISVMSWMAGLLYLPRLFVYHCEAKAGSDFSQKLKIMEHRLLHIIMRPARIATVFFGGLLLIIIDASQWLEVWLYIKLVCVLILFGMHDIMNKWRKNFFEDINTKTQKFYRVMNEVPTILMIVVVLVVVIKPF
jgi:putative membrane protein